MKLRRKKKGDLVKEFYIYIYIYRERERERERVREKKKKKKRVGCHILIGVIVANLNFSSGLVDVKLFCSG